MSIMDFVCTFTKLLIQCSMDNYSYAKNVRKKSPADKTLEKIKDSVVNRWCKQLAMH